MKNLLIALIFSTLVASGHSQTKSVLVNTNNAVVSPTNFWSADASNARTGLGLGSAATNPASAFQPSSSSLTNLSTNNGLNLTNIQVSNVVGALATNGNGGGLTNLTASSIVGTVALASNVSGTVAISNGGTGATNAGQARTNLGATTIGNALFTATNSAAAIDAIGISTNFSDQLLSVSNIEISTFPAGSGTGFVVPTTGQTLSVRGTNVSSGTSAFFGWDGVVQTAFSAAQSRTNLGLNSWVTNTNSPVFVSTNGEVISPTNFWQAAPIVTAIQNITPVATSTNAATNARLLFLFSLAPSTVGVTNTITLPTNGNTFNGDVATITHSGPTSSVTAIRSLGAATNLITLNQPEETVRLLYRNNQWTLMDNISQIEPIYFSGTNAAANAAASRTNLGLGELDNVTFSNVNTIGLTIIDETNAQIAFEGNSAAITRTNLGLGAGLTTNLVLKNSANVDTYMNFSNGILIYGSTTPP